MTKRKGKYIAVRRLSRGDLVVQPGAVVPDEIVKSSSFDWLLADGDIKKKDSYKDDWVVNLDDENLDEIKED
jgi:hypothetical protein